MAINGTVPGPLLQMCERVFSKLKKQSDYYNFQQRWTMAV